MITGSKTKSNRKKVTRVNSNYDSIDRNKLIQKCHTHNIGLHSYKSSTASIKDDVMHIFNKNDQTLHSGKSLGDKSTLNSSKAKSRSSLKVKSKTKIYTKPYVPFATSKVITPILKSRQASITRNSTTQVHPMTKISYARPIYESLKTSRYQMSVGSMNKSKSPRAK